jgi:4-hydroxy-2-oxoheptanedioate aldolase
MRKNVLREALKADRPTIGTHVHSTWPGMVEVIGHSGVIDYVEFVGTYAPYDLYALENFGRAVDLFDHMTSLIKVDQEPRAFIALRAFGSGIQNMLFADIRSPEDARQAVACIRPETPQAGGIAGIGMRRDVGYVVEPGSADYAQALEDAVVALMIEKQAAVERLEDILAVGSVDMIVFGPADYSLSIGLPGQWDHPKIVEARDYVFETALKMGVQPRVEIDDFREAEPYLEMGIKHFSVGYEVQVIYDFCREQGVELAKLLGK